MARDGQTDRQTTCDRNTALCTKVHRAVKTASATKHDVCTWFITEMMVMALSELWKADSSLQTNARQHQRIEFFVQMLSASSHGVGQTAIPIETRRCTARRPLWHAAIPDNYWLQCRLSQKWSISFPTKRADVRAVRAWNGLPDFVTGAPTFSSFCTVMKTYLFSRTFWHWQHTWYFWLSNVFLYRLRVQHVD